MFNVSLESFVTTINQHWNKNDFKTLFKFFYVIYYIHGEFIKTLLTISLYRLFKFVSSNIHMKRTLPTNLSGVSDLQVFDDATVHIIGRLVSILVLGVSRV